MDSCTIQMLVTLAIGVLGGYVLSGTVVGKHADKRGATRERWHRPDSERSWDDDGDWS